MQFRTTLFCILLLLILIVPLALYLYRYRLYYLRPADNKLLDDLKRRSMPTVVFVLYAEEDDLEKMPQLIANLQQQTVLGTRGKIVVTYPKEQVLAKARNINERVVQYMPMETRGACAAYRAVLDTFSDPETRVVPVHLRATFPPQYFEELVWFSIMDSSRVYGYSGFRFLSDGHKDGHYRRVIGKYASVDAVDSKTGAVYVRKMLDTRADFDKDHPCADRMDLVLSRMATNKGYDTFLLNAVEKGRHKGRPGHEMYLDEATVANDRGFISVQSDVCRCLQALKQDDGAGAAGGPEKS